MTDIARNVCVTVGKDHIGNNDGAQQILRILLERFEPDTIDVIYQEGAKFMNFRRADHAMDVYLIEFDVSREKAEARMVMGIGSPANSSPSSTCATRPY